MGGAVAGLWRRQARKLLVAITASSILSSAVQPAVWGATIVPTGPGAVSIGPQAMEGNLQIHPGDAVKAGYDFTMPGSHPAATVTVQNASVKLLVKCSNGTTPAPIAIALPPQAYSDPAGSPNWYPSGDQSSSAVYQGSVTAPDRCSGGVMSDAQGALFLASFISTDISDPVNLRFHYSDNTSGSWSATVRTTPSPIAKTFTSAVLTPALALTLSADKSNAVPGDTITYSGTVTNTGAALVLSGDFFADGTGSQTRTVAGYWDEFATSVTSGQWTPFAGFSNAQSGYTFLAPAPINTGMTLSASSVPSPNVTYPSSGDLILGTTIAAGAGAQWHYQAVMPLTPSQVNFLLDPTRVKNVRNSLHVEVTPSAGTPATVDIDFTDFFLGATPAPSGTVTNVTVSVQPPGGGTPIVITSSTVPALGALTTGSAANYSATFRVPAVAAKGTSETDSAYMSRLASNDGSALQATAVASGASTGGTVTSATASATTTEHVPIVTIAKSGPPTADAGTTASYPLALKNSGGATASALAISDSLPGGASGTVSGIPSSMAAGASATAQASYAIPAGQAPGNLPDTAAVTWQDANGNAYGPVSSSFTTSINNSLVGATLTLSPSVAGPILTGNSQTMQATLLNRFSLPVANRQVAFSVTGANTARGNATTDASGNATFAYTGTNTGSDTVQASVPSTSPLLQSNSASVSWVTLSRPITISPVQGNFYAINFPYGVLINPSFTPPTFSQTFPDILFNPPPDIVPHNVSGVGEGTAPFTDLTTDLNGNYDGTIAAQGTDPSGNHQVAGVGQMAGFQSEFTGTFTVAAAGNVAFLIHASGPVLFGIGNNATRVSGTYTFAPNPPVTPFQGYPLMMSRDKDKPTAGLPAVVNFPAPGSYPFEIDYVGCCSDALLTLRAAAVQPDPTGLSVFAGYAETHPGGPGGGFLPSPWQGSPNTAFMGVLGPFSWDNGAIRIDNPGTTPVTLDDVSLDVGTKHFDQWGSNLVVPAGGTLIVTQTADQSLDTSDINVPSCQIFGTVPIVHIKLNGIVRDYPDVTQVLNTAGSDLANCGFTNESQQWLSIPFGPNFGPVSPVATIALTPATLTNATVGLAQTLTAAAMDSTGRPMANLSMTLSVLGPNGGQLTGTTDASGFVNFSYVGLNQGTDNIQVSATIAGARTVSNVATVAWTNPPGPSPGSQGPPPPSITAVSPADGATVTKPVPISATIAPPSGQTIASWIVTYQDLDPSTPVTLASGTGAPPATLATFDPTLLPNDTYALTISATASGGGTQTLTTSVIVFGNLKLGRYVTTYQDLNVPVNGYQMQVRRTYDSIDKRLGDFGIGWKVELVNFRTSTNRALGAGGWTQYDTLCAIGLCLTAFKSSAPHYVVVVFPDGHDEIFDFTPTGGTNVFLDGGAAFTARPGTTSMLQADGNTTLTYSFDGNLYDGNGVPFNPQRFRLTTHDGHVLLLDRTTGLISESDRNGNTLTVDGTGVHSSTGSSITLTRDSANGNRITAVTGPSGERLSYAYTAVGDLSTSTDPNGNVTTYSYDTNHDLLSATGPGQSRPLTTLSYDTNGRLTSIIDGNGNTTQVTSNVAGQQQTVTDATGLLTMVQTDDDIGDVVRRDLVESGKALTSTYTYDSVGRLLNATDPLGHSTSYAYDASGDVVQTTDAIGNTSRFAYDSSGHLLSAIAPDGSALETLAYDSNGNLTTITRQDGSSLLFAHDSAGRIVRATDFRGNAETVTYDSFGHVASTTDPLGDVTQYTSDSSGRITSLTDATGSVTTMTYDSNGNLLSTTDGLSHMRSYVYDGQDRLTTATDQLGHNSTFAYDGAGNLATVTNRDGKIASFTYDADGRLLTETLPGNDVTSYVYDPPGDVLSAGNSNVVLNFSYDAAGRLTSQGTAPASTSAQPTTTLTYAYDAADRLTSSAGPDGTIAYAYDVNSRLTSLTDPAGGLFGFSYDSVWRLTGLTRPNGVADALTYDSAGNLLSRTATLGATSLYSAAYTYDQNGRRSSFTDPTGTSSYTFSAVGELTAASHPTAGLASEQFSYDGAGNRTASATMAAGSFSYDNGNRLLGDARFTYTYDNEGDLTSKRDKSSGATTTYAWNMRHQLAAITFPDASVTSYRYDPLGRRIEINASGAITREAYDGQNLRLQYDGTNTLAGSFVDAGIDGHLETTQASQRLFFVQDGSNSTVELTNSAGGVVASDTYDSFGNPAASNNLTPSIPLTYTGREFDAKSGLYYYRSRYYAPNQGRFLSEDPIAHLNAYTYTQNDPIDFADPSGSVLTEYAVLTANEQRVNFGQCISMAVDAAANVAAVGVSAGFNQPGAAASEAESALVGGAENSADNCAFAAVPAPATEGGEFVSVFHGSFHEASSIVEGGLDLSRGSAWVSRDIAAARDAIGPGRVAIEGPGRDPGIIESRIPRADFERVLGPSERSYSGFFGSGLDSSEIVLRTKEQFDLFNQFIVGLAQ